MTPLLDVVVDPGSGHTVVVVRGRIFADTVDPLRAALTPLLDTGRPRLVLDLSEVEICDSSGLNLIAASHQAAAARGGWLRLAGLQPIVRRVVNVTNLDRLVSVHPTVDDAVHGLDRGVQPPGGAPAG